MISDIYWLTIQLQFIQKIVLQQIELFPHGLGFVYKFNDMMTQ